MNPQCPVCQVELSTVPPNEPWHPEYLFCPKCNAAFSNNDEVANYERLMAIEKLESLIKELKPTTFAEEVEKLQRWVEKEREKRGLVDMKLTLNPELMFGELSEDEIPPVYKSLIRELNRMNEAVDDGKTRPISEDL